MAEIISMVGIISVAEATSPLVIVASQRTLSVSMLCEMSGTGKPE